MERKQIHVSEIWILQYLSVLFIIMLTEYILESKIASKVYN